MISNFINKDLSLQAYEYCDKLAASLPSTYNRQLLIYEIHRALHIGFE